MAIVLQRELIDQLNEMGPEEMLSWAYAHHGERAAIVTSFQNTGCVQIDMAHRVAPGLRVVTVDTLRLPDETYQLIEAIERHYGVQIERFKPDPVELERMVAQHGEYLFFDSKAKQEFCCNVRKVKPNLRALETLDVWIAGVRRDQSATRKATPRAQYIEQDKRPILKLSPLADWSEEQVWEYIRSNEVPYNKLYDMGYTSIGCKICTTPTLPWEDKRAGRWRWQNQDNPDGQKECGIHLSGSGI
jgi:phosphoadenylyl-sulfate reductase (thioredoxin)